MRTAVRLATNFPLALLGWSLCKLGAHDWSNQDGVCAYCEHEDADWERKLADCLHRIV